MAQFELAEIIFESDTGLRVDEMMRQTGNVESSVRMGLSRLQQKDIVIEEDGHYFPDPDEGEQELERIRTYTLEELSD